MYEIFQTVLNFIANVGIIVLIIGLLVFIHELGHYLAARMSGMLVEEFAIGFGPKLFAYKKGDTEYMIKLFPLGGYVKILGEAGEEQEWLAAQKKFEARGEVNPNDRLTKEEIKEIKEEIEKINNDPRSFNNKSKWARFFVMIAGVTMNYLLAVLCFYIWLSANNYTIQLPGNMMDFEPAFAQKTLIRTDDVKYGALLEDGAAAKLGMPEKGIVRSINGENLEYSFDLRKKIEEKAGQVVLLNVCDLGSGLDADAAVGDENCRDYNLQLGEDGKAGIFLNTNYYVELKYVGAGQLLSGFANSVDNLRLMGYVLSSMFSTAKETGDYQDVAVNSFSSPIALYFVVDSFKEYGAIAIIRLIGEFSFSLAIINILPIPALDGGRIFLLIIEFIRRKPLDRKVENAIIAISFYALMFLMLAVVLKDIIFINVIKDMF